MRRMTELIARYGSRTRTLLGESGQIIDGDVQPVTTSVKARALPPVEEPRNGNVSNAARVVASMRAGFRNCYNRGLATHRWLEGTVKLTIGVVLDCILRRAGAKRFDPPEGGSATTKIPIRFVRE